MHNFYIYKQDEAINIKPDSLFILARYQGKWLLFRSSVSGRLYIPQAENVADEPTAKVLNRALGAHSVTADINPSPILRFRYGEHEGALYYAEITYIGSTAEASGNTAVELFEYIPKNITENELYSVLFSSAQGWLNLLSSPDEEWDVYDEERRLTGKHHRRGMPLGEGEYHLVVQAWIRRSNGDFLLTKRSPNKGNPNMWEATGGSALAGDSSITAAIREIREETGLILYPDMGRRVITKRSNECFVDVWLFDFDFLLEDVVLQEGETCDKRYATPEDIMELRRLGMLVPYSYIDPYQPIESNPLFSENPKSV